MSADEIAELRRMCRSVIDHCDRSPNPASKISTALYIARALLAVLDDPLKDERVKELVEAATKLAKRHGNIAFNAGGRYGVSESTWLAADEALTETRAALKALEKK